MTEVKNDIRRAIIPTALLVLTSDALSAIGVFMTGHTPATPVTVSAIVALVGLALTLPRQQPVESPPQEKVP